MYIPRIPLKSGPTKLCMRCDSRYSVDLDKCDQCNDLVDTELEEYIGHSEKELDLLGWIFIFLAVVSLGFTCFFGYQLASSNVIYHYGLPNIKG